MRMGFKQNRCVAHDVIWGKYCIALDLGKAMVFHTQPKNEVIKDLPHAIPPTLSCFLIHLHRNQRHYWLCWLSLEAAARFRFFAAMAKAHVAASKCSPPPAF
jgi:hypothetical protein